eukprot:9488648-Pyramimonas_sp.AAC.1
MPFVDADRIDEHCVESPTRALSTDRHVVREQAQRIFKQELTDLKNKMPTCIRGRSIPPTVESITMEAQ